MKEIQNRAMYLRELNIMVGDSLMVEGLVPRSRPPPLNPALETSVVGWCTTRGETNSITWWRWTSLYTELTTMYITDIHFWIIFPFWVSRLYNSFSVIVVDTVDLSGLSDATASHSVEKKWQSRRPIWVVCALQTSRARTLVFALHWTWQVYN